MNRGGGGGKEEDSPVTMYSTKRWRVVEGNKYLNGRFLCYLKTWLERSHQQRGVFCDNHTTDDLIRKNNDDDDNGECPIDSWSSLSSSFAWQILSHEKQWAMAESYCHLSSSNDWDVGGERLI